MHQWLSYLEREHYLIENVLCNNGPYWLCKKGLVNANAIPNTFFQKEQIGTLGLTLNIGP